ncbi:DUF1433 domain-containing protein [Staphylococcus edaphicus]|uniref:DUF1433 domain-containing protein n=1 Tax=Staphylococcus edaphicus TaxID=1955013 RepID=A0A2C6U659_9STAP|nr:DUF1433 domain-containing protein [Staphylococcus edaphicus]PHK49332.1 hypothetical protein BTJ66_09195 [Staphylococcus edaphicus]UQW80964.1 DUF1433 domain-containing protein [Staphylococcus edaphicus]
MRNKNKIFVLISIIVILLLVGLYLSHKNKKDTYFETQKDRIDLYFKYNLKDYHTLKITKFEQNPMGGFFVDGYINNDKTLEFEAYISSADNHQFTGDVGYDTDGVGKLFKEKNAKDKLTPNDIIKKENLNKKDYEADPPLIWGF